MFVLGKPLQPSLMFVNKARSQSHKTFRSKFTNSFCKLGHFINVKCSLNIQFMPHKVL